MVNRTLDVQGFNAAIQSVFDIHQNGHGNAVNESGLPILMNLDHRKGQINKKQGAARRLRGRSGSRTLGRVAPNAEP